MQTAVNALAILSFLGVVILLFGMGVVLSLVRGLQESVLELASAGGRSADRLEDFATGEVGTVALVVTGHCPSCRQRADHLRSRSRTSTVRLVLVSADPLCASWGGSEVHTVIDATLVGRMTVTATPTAVAYDGTGMERFRRIVGSDEELTTVIDMCSSPAASRPAAAP